MDQNAENIGIVSINDRSEPIFGENDENVARHKKPWWYKTSEIRRYPTFIYYPKIAFI